jgi:hypothetical protein
MATTAIPEKIPDLWPDDIRADLRTPLAILRAQGNLLVRRTQGILEADVLTAQNEGSVQHNLDVIAPGVGYYRKTVIAARHQYDLPYPVTVISEAFVPKREFPAVPSPAVVRSLVLGAAPENEREAATQEEFINLVREVLQSGYVKAIVQSLVARTNEFQEMTKPPEQKDSTGPETATGNSENGPGK